MKLLDTTLRDGSYAINFKYTLDDVQAVIEKLEKLGFELIEIGHGMGLNASCNANGKSLHSDKEYMRIAQQTAKKAKWGFFAIPSIATKKDVKLLKNNGGDFIRIGNDSDDILKTLDLASYAKEQGLLVMINFMKTYLIPPLKFAEYAHILEKEGIDYVYIVDSAGYMLPDELYEYYVALKEQTGIKLGFHGHNNLGLAVANSAYCCDLGFDIVDCSFQGLGRSAGNASSEMLIMMLKRKGYDLDIDIPCLLEYGYTLLKEVTDEPLVNPLDYICGYTGLHSRYLKDIYRCANKYRVDPLRLIIVYCEKNKKEMDMDLLEHVASYLPRDDAKHPYNFLKYLKD